MTFPLSNNQWKWLAYFWILFCTVLFCMPGDALPKTRLIDIPFFDKWVHTFLFAVLNFLLLKAYYKEGPKTMVIWLTLLICYGVLIEVVQLYLIPFRSFDWVDILADTLGIFLGLVAFQRTRASN